MNSKGITITVKEAKLLRILRAVEYQVKNIHGWKSLGKDTIHVRKAIAFAKSNPNEILTRAHTGKGKK